MTLDSSRRIIARSPCSFLADGAIAQLGTLIHASRRTLKVIDSFRSWLHNYDMGTICENLSDVDGTWNIYSHDFPTAPTLVNLEDQAFDDNWDSTGGLKTMRRMARCRLFGDYSFIEPKYTSILVGAHDQRPPTAWRHDNS